MKTILAPLAVFSAALMLAGTANAGPNEDLVLAIDVQAADSLRTCPVEYESCAEITASASQGIHDFLIVATGFASVRAIEYGIVWPPEWTFQGFTSCSPLTSTTPAEGGGLFIAQGYTTPLAQAPGHPVALGWVRLAATSAGVMNLVAAAGGDGARVIHPSLTMDEISALGSAGIGGAEGNSICP